MVLKNVLPIGYYIVYYKKYWPILLMSVVTLYSNIDDKAVARNFSGNRDRL